MIQDAYTASVGATMSNDRGASKEIYPDAIEEIDLMFPELRGPSLQLSISFDATTAHDKMSRCSIEGTTVYLGSTLIESKSKRQTSIASSTYTSVIHSGRTASETAYDFRFCADPSGLNRDAGNFTGRR